MAIPAFTCKIDTSNFMVAHQILHRNSKNQAESLHKAVAFVVDDAKRRTPTVFPDEIVSDLGVMVVPLMGKRGKPLSSKYAKNVRYASTGPGSGKRHTPDEFPLVPLSWLMIGARAKASSKYNVEITGGRYAIKGGHPFKGHKVSQFAAIMLDYVSRMVKQRRKSTNFFQSSWSAILFKMAPFVPRGFQAKFFKAAGKAGAINMELGEFFPADNNATIISCRIENRVGMDSGYPVLDENRNAAAHRILGPVLQDAIDRNFLEQMEIARAKSLLNDKNRLRTYGVIVT